MIRGAHLRAVAAVALASAGVWAAPPPQCTVSGCQAALDRIGSWVQNSVIPSGTEEYYSLDSQHVFDVNAYKISAHNPPNDPFSSDSDAAAKMLDTIAALLSRGLQRLEASAQTLLSRQSGDAWAGNVLALTRAVINSFEDFWTQAKMSIGYGADHVTVKKRAYLEYGLETNFWVKFRPYLACRSTRRIGPEIGGSKIWCNPEYFAAGKPWRFFSAGSGFDFVYENIMFQWFPEAKIVTADCFMSEADAFQTTGWSRSKLLFKGKCLHGSIDGDEVGGVPQGSYANFTGFLADLSPDGIDAFDALKVNIEMYEYGMFGHIFHGGRSEALLRGTAQIHLEHHRPGMQGQGLSWASLLWSELLWATFMSGGYHPVATEKWHDSTACQDVTFVNQTWFLESELDAVVRALDAPPRTLVEFPEEQGYFKCEGNCAAFAELVEANMADVRAKLGGGNV